MYPMTWRRSPHLILACAVVVLLLAMGVRAIFGLFMRPMGMARGWAYEHTGSYDLMWWLGPMAAASAREPS